MSEKTYTRREMTAVLEARRWTPRMIRQFFAVYADHESFDMDMVERMECSVNCDVFARLNPTAKKKV